MTKLAYKINIWLKYSLKKSIKGWNIKWKLSKSSKKFCRIHFYTMSTHSYSVSLQQMLADCCIRNSWAGGGFLILRSHNCIRFQLWSHCLWRVLSKTTNPKSQHIVKGSRNPALGMLLRPIHLLALWGKHLQQTELSSFTLSCIAVGRGYLCISYKKMSHRQTGKKSLVLFITEYQFTEL